MATNSGRGNPIAAEDGPPAANTATPPVLSPDIKSAILAQEHDTNSLQHGGLGSTGLHDAGEDKDKDATLLSTSSKPGSVPRAEDEPQPMDNDKVS